MCHRSSDARETGGAYFLHRATWPSFSATTEKVPDTPLAWKMPRASVKPCALIEAPSPGRMRRAGFGSAFEVAAIALRTAAPDHLSSVLAIEESIIGFR